MSGAIPPLPSRHVQKKLSLLTLQKKRQKIKSVGVNETGEGRNKKESNIAKVKGVCMLLRRTVNK